MSDKPQGGKQGSSNQPMPPPTDPKQTATPRREQRNDNNYTRKDYKQGTRHK